jgi:hypothetical protein
MVNPLPWQQELTQAKQQLLTTPNNVYTFSTNKTFLDNDLTNKWLHRLRMTATTNEARDKLGQLSTILEHLNKPSHNTGLQV